MNLDENIGRTRRTAGLFLAPALFLAVYLVPLPLDPPAHALAAVFAMVIVFWVTEAIPVAAASVLGPALAVPLGVAGAKDAFASFGHPIIFLFMGSFLIAGAMMKHGLDRRIALFVLSRSWIRESPTRILLAFGAIAAGLSMWMSNTATTAMMLPIALGVLRTLPMREADRHGGRSYATGLMLMIAFSAGVGGIATPVGTPPNLIAIGMIEKIFHHRISFPEWMLFGVPIAAVGFVLVFLVLRRAFPPKHARLEGASDVIRAARRRLGPWSAGEKASLTAFLVAVMLWTVPGLVALALGPGSKLASSLQSAFPEGVVAILAASLLFVIPVDWGQRRFALDWREAVKIDWGTILLFGGGLSLGGLAFDTKLAGALGGALGVGAGVVSVPLLLLLAVLGAAFLTGFMPNTATANLLVPIFLALAEAPGRGSVLPALAAALGCSIAFCLPVSTPPNAIVYGSGEVPLTSMIRAGIFLDLLFAVATWGTLLLLRGWIGF